MAIETEEARRWILTALQADAALTAVVGTRIYPFTVPRNSAYPLVVFNLQASIDVQPFGTNRSMTQALFQFKTISKNGVDANARTAADRVDTIIGTANAQTSNGYIFSARREQVISLDEVDPQNFDTYHSIGGLYRIYITH